LALPSSLKTLSAIPTNGNIGAPSLQLFSILFFPLTAYHFPCLRLTSIVTNTSSRLGSRCSRSPLSALASHQQVLICGKSTKILAFMTLFQQDNAKKLTLLVAP